MKVKVKSLSRVQPSATPWTAAFQAPLSMGFSRQEYWSGVQPVQSDVLKSPISDFPGGPGVKTLPSNTGGAGLIPSQGAKDPTYLAAKKPKHKRKAIL